MDAAAWIAEQRIREAQEQGLLDVPGWKGRALQLDDDSAVPLRLVFRILKDAGVLPPELELRKEILTLRDMLACVEEGEKQARLKRDLNDRVLRLKLLRRGRVDLDEAELLGSRERP